MLPVVSDPRLFVVRELDMNQGEEPDSPSGIPTVAAAVLIATAGLVILGMIVMAAAVVGSFAFTPGTTTESPSQTGPTVQLAFDYNESGSSVVIQHAGGDPVAGENLTVLVERVDQEVTVEGTFSSGDSVTVRLVAPGNTVEVYAGPVRSRNKIGKYIVPDSP